MKSVESGHTRQKRSFSSRLNGNSMRTDDHRVALAGYLQMMLDALIKWRLPFPMKGAAHKKYQSSPPCPRRMKSFRASLRLRYPPRRSPLSANVLFKNDVQQVSTFICIFYVHFKLCGIPLFFILFLINYSCV